VCSQLGRRFVLIDKNPIAIDVIRRRLDGAARSADAASA
jgi:DNA modification methylase